MTDHVKRSTNNLLWHKSGFFTQDVRDNAAYVGAIPPSHISQKMPMKEKLLNSWMSAERSRFESAMCADGLRHLKVDAPIYEYFMVTFTALNGKSFTGAELKAKREAAAKQLSSLSPDELDRHDPRPIAAPFHIAEGFAFEALRKGYVGKVRRPKTLKAA